jgi:hypothetical protein
MVRLLKVILENLIAQVRTHLKIEPEVVIITILKENIQDEKNHEITKRK